MSSFLSRRVHRRQADAIQLLISFPLQQEWFALPIQVAQRVVPLQQVYGRAANGILGLTRYQNQEIVVLDVRSRIFSSPLPDLLPAVTGEGPVAQPHLLIIDRLSGYAPAAAQCDRVPDELVGIRLEAPPVLRRVPRSAFSPIPATYLIESGIRCVSALVQSGELEPPLFFLNLEQLLQVRSLPASSPSSPTL